MGFRMRKDLFLFLVFLCGSLCASNTDFTKEGKVHVSGAVRSLLTMKETPHETENLPHELPEKYLLDLYDQYKKERTSSLGNTVRSIFPFRGNFHGVDMLVYNLTGIHANEPILQVMLHLKKGRTSSFKRRHTVAPYKLQLVDIKLHSDLQWFDLSNRRDKRWLVFDVTESIKKCISSKKTKEHLLAVTIRKKHRNKWTIPVSFGDILRQVLDPFLIIFSEHRSKSFIQNVDWYPKNLLEHTHILSEETYNSSQSNNSVSMQEILKSRFRGSNDLLLSNAPTEEKQLIRIERSLPSNNVPDDIDDVFNSSSISDKHSVKYFKKLDSDTLPVPHNRESKKKHPFRKKANRRKNRKLPLSWVKHEYKRIEHINDKPCRRKKLTVDFSKLGWTEWIIAPSAFNSYYCEGSCSFPQIKNGRPSNHATIQSLIHALGENTEIPEPCCIPSATSSLTMLYLDENNRVVLKNYPNMIVESCACR